MPKSKTKVYYKLEGEDSVGDTHGPYEWIQIVRRELRVGPHGVVVGWYDQYKEMWRNADGEMGEDIIIFPGEDG